MTKIYIILLLAVAVFILARVAGRAHNRLRRSRAQILKRMRDEE